jgi:hypothetical protein
MKRPWLLLVLVLLLLAAGVLGAQAAAEGYALAWWTVDGGGGDSAGAPYTLSGTAGQPDSGPRLAGGRYALTGGYWVGGQNRWQVFAPLILR